MFKSKGRIKSHKQPTAMVVTSLLMGSSVSAGGISSG